MSLRKKTEQIPVSHLLSMVHWFAAAVCFLSHLYLPPSEDKYLHTFLQLFFMVLLFLRIHHFGQLVYIINF